MLQRRIALDAFRRAGLFPPEKAGHLRPLMAWIDENPELCWADIVPRVRSEHAKAIEPLAAAIWRSGDPLLRANLIRNLDPQRPEEAAVAEKLIGLARGDHDEAALRAALDWRDPRLFAAVARKRALPIDLRREIDALRLGSLEGPDRERTSFVSERDLQLDTLRS